MLTLLLFYSFICSFIVIKIVAIRLRQLMYFKDEFYSTLEPAARVYDLLTHKPRIGLYGGLKPDDTKIIGNLVFTNCMFAYPSRPNVKVLRGASFEVVGGTMCALVGPSGSGERFT